MAGVNSVIRVIAAILTLLVLIFVTGVGLALYEPIARSLGDTPASLGWSDPNFLFFMALGLVGLTITVIIWLIVAPVRNDVRQETRRPPF